jgi:hypothetical protein
MWNVRQQMNLTGVGGCSSFSLFIWESGQETQPYVKKTKGLEDQHILNSSTPNSLTDFIIQTVCQTCHRCSVIGQNSLGSWDLTTYLF